MKYKNMSNGKVFAVCLPEQYLPQLRILAQILTYSLVITLQWTARIVLLVLNSLCFQVRSNELGAFPRTENSHCGPEMPSVYSTITNCNVKLGNIFICLINNRDFISILTCCLLNVTHFYVNIDNSVDCVQPFLICFIFYLFITFYPVFISFILQYHIDYT
jgi:hypothetical protein